MSAHADDVIINFSCVYGIDFTSVDLLLELLNNRRAVRARQKEVPRHQSRPARVLDQVLDELRRIGIHKTVGEFLADRAARQRRSQ